jgi:hypothetical protein
VADRTLSNQWWLFAVARAGTGAVHSLATGLGALGFYGLFRREPRYMVGYPLAVLTHATWNFLSYTLAGDAFFTKSGPDSRFLDVLSVIGLVAVFGMCVVLLWTLPRRLKDNYPAPIYRLLGMLPAEGAQMLVVSPAPVPAPTARAPEYL